MTRPHKTDAQKPRPSRSAKANKLTVAKIKEALEQSAGIRVQAAKMLNVERRTLYRWIAKHPELQDALADIDERHVDIAESNVLSAMASKDETLRTNTSKWFLERKGRRRGYSTRVETTGPDGGPIEYAPLGLDLSKLTDKELAQLYDLQAKAVSSSTGGTAKGTGVPGP